MRADKPCTTCALHYRGRCAEWDMPTEAARHAGIVDSRAQTRSRLGAPSRPPKARP